MTPVLVQIAIQEIPDIIALLKKAFGKANPDAAVPTDAEVIAAYQSALASSLAKDAQWLAAHPE